MGTFLSFTCGSKGQVVTATLTDFDSPHNEKTSAQITVMRDGCLYQSSEGVTDAFLVTMDGFSTFEDAAKAAAIRLISDLKEGHVFGRDLLVISYKELMKEIHQARP